MTKLKFGEHSIDIEKTFDMKLDDVKRLRDWCEMALSVRSDLVVVTEAVAAAVAAYTRGEFVNKNSREIWDMGYEVDSDDFVVLDHDDMTAMVNPETNELEVYAHGVSARLNMITGSMVLL